LADLEKKYSDAREGIPLRLDQDVEGQRGVVGVGMIAACIAINA